MKEFYRWHSQDCLTLFCHLQPKAGKDEFAGLYDGRLKIRIKALPVDGQANTALLKFIARQFAVPRARVSIRGGDSSRQKTLSVLQPAHLPEQLGIKAPA